VSNTPKKQWTLFTFGIILLLLALQLPGLQHAFLADDFDWVTNARHAVSSDNWFQPFTVETGGHFYRPIVALGFEIDYAISGLHPLAYHIDQLAFHILLVLGVALLVWQLTKSRKLAFTVSLLFAVFPNQHEVVTWLAGRPDLYAATFGVWSVGLCVYFVKSNRWWAYTISIILSALAMLSKEIAFVLPVLILAACIASSKENLKKTALRSAWAFPWVALLGFVLLARNHILNTPLGGYVSGGQAQTTQFSFGNISQIFLSGFNVFNWSYLSEILNHNIWYRAAFSVWTFFTDYWLVFVLLAIAGLFWYGKRTSQTRKRFLLFSITWIIVSFIPVFGLADEISLTRLVASRLFFFAAIGYALLFALLLTPRKTYKSASRKILWSAYIMVVLICLSLWKINFIPWKTAAQDVSMVTQNLKTQQLQDNSPILFKNLPQLVHGAYAFFGKHAVRGVVYEVTGNDNPNVFLNNDQPYTSSPACSCSDPKLQIFQWSSQNESLIKETAFSKKWNAAAKSCTDTTIARWDFSHAEDRAVWNVIDLNSAIGSDGLLLTIPKKSNGALQYTGLSLLGAEARNLTITFEVVSTHQPVYTTNLAWGDADSLPANQQIAFSFSQNSDIRVSIPLCQYMNWAGTENISKLRIRPMSGATIILKTIALQ